MTSFEMPVGIVRRTQAGKIRRGSIDRLQPCWHSQSSAEEMKSPGRESNVIQINVDATKVSEDKVSDHVGPLYGLWIGVERVEEPWVRLRDECP